MLGRTSPGVFTLASIVARHKPHSSHLSSSFNACLLVFQGQAGARLIGGSAYTTTRTFLGFPRGQLFGSTKPAQEASRQLSVDEELLDSDNHAIHPSNVMDNVSPIPASTAFAKFGLRESILRSLSAANIVEETDIQAEAIPHLMKGKGAVLLSQTGTGKTHTYLLPIMEQLKREEDAGIERRPHRPRALIVVPNRELAEQTTEFIKQIGHHCKLRVVMLSGGTKIKMQRVALESPVDIVVATPGRLMVHKEKGNFFFSEVRYFVMDEIDSLLNNTFDDEILPMLKSMGSKKHVQKILAGATLNTRMSRRIETLFPDLEEIATKSVHRTVLGMVERYVDVPGNEDKHDSLAEQLGSVDSKRTLVFCNTVASCRSTEHTLAEKGFSTVGFHGDIPPMTRASNYDSFIAGKCDILVATDCASRGLDTLNVDHVVNFDFPNNIEDYIHRVGRTARAGRSGLVTSLITKKDRALSNAIKEANKWNLPLSDLSASRDANERVLAKLRSQASKFPRTSMEFNRLQGHEKGRKGGSKISPPPLRRKAKSK